MSVRNRIKLLNVNSFQDAEDKVNDFLSNDPDVAELVHIDYRLEYNLVIIEYYIFSNNNDNNNNNKSEIIAQYEIPYYLFTNPYLDYCINLFWRPLSVPNGH